MKLPDGYIVKFRTNKRCTEVIMEQEELITCKKCIYRNTGNCKWRNDESPDDDDYCSIAERGD